MTYNGHKPYTGPFAGQYVSGTEYNDFGSIIGDIYLRFNGMSAMPPEDKAVFYPAHVSLKEMAEFQFYHRDLVSPWGTPAGQFVLGCVAGKEGIELPFETFQKLRRDLLSRFCKAASGNLTIVNPRPETEPKRGIFFDYMIPMIRTNCTITEINSEDKDRFIERYSRSVNACRNRERSHEKSFSATVFRIK